VTLIAYKGGPDSFPGIGRRDRATAFQIADIGRAETRRPLIRSTRDASWRRMACSLRRNNPEPQNLCSLCKPIPMSGFLFGCVERQRPKFPFDGIEILWLGLNVGAVRRQRMPFSYHDFVPHHDNVTLGSRVPRCGNLGTSWMRAPTVGRHLILEPRRRATNRA
jgi:hypothetical protein